MPTHKYFQITERFINMKFYFDVHLQTLILQCKPYNFNNSSILCFGFMWFIYYYQQWKETPNLFWLFYENQALMHIIVKYKCQLFLILPCKPIAIEIAYFGWNLCGSYNIIKNEKRLSLLDILCKSSFNAHYS